MKTQTNPGYTHLIVWKEAICVDVNQYIEVEKSFRTTADAVRIHVESFRRIGKAVEVRTL